MASSRIPQDRSYTRAHLWVKQDEGGVLVGITARIIERLGPLIAVELPEPDDEMMCGVPFGAIEGMEGLHELVPPGDAQVLEVNESVMWDVDLLKSDPYAAGWLLRIKMHDPSQLDDVLDAAGYAKHCEKSWKKKGAKK